MQKHTKRSIIVWILTILIILFGFLPYRLSLNRNYKSQQNVLLVDHSECTCCADFDIVEGTISLPDSLKTALSKPNLREIEVIGSSTPFNHFKNEASIFDLIVGNTIILKGEVVGLDRKYESECGSKPIFKITSWGLKTYYPRFMTFGGIGMLIYIFVCAIAIIISFVRIIRQFTKTKEPNNNHKSNIKK